jgi:putative heme-binding domain-containing protein
MKNAQMTIRYRLRPYAGNRFTHAIRIWLAAVCAVSITSIAFAQNPLSVSRPEADNSVAAELKSFALIEGYEANLYADETDGVANPVCMSWDPAGRLWVLVTSAYPQLKPTDKPNDKLLILTDTNADGRADKTTVFADGLNMPTGFALGHGGAYIGQGNDFLHLKDNDGDDKADTRRVLLTGFGTGDTHQNINSFTWSPGGELLFCQGLHAFSRVETPWGISRLDEHGSWRLRPKRLQLHGFRRSGGDGNPWGIAFGNWGEPFVKGNGQGVFELLPGMVSTKRIASYWGREMTIGQTRIKSMIIEFAESPHLPDDIQGEMLIAGYFARDINRFQWETDGAGHRLKLQPNLMASSHKAFRPVDIRIGPDGAIYIADWFNPIIGHYQASFRHPDRDKTHGRIWRVTAKDRPLVTAPDLSRMSAADLCKQLKSDWRYVRYQSKRRLADLPKNEVVPVITKWVNTLDQDDPNIEHHLYQAIGVFESHEVVNRPLLERLLKANDYRARAYATRVVGRWHDRLESPLELLEHSVVDESARVRLEAVVACSDIHSAESMAIAAKAASHPMDRFTNFALTQTVHALAPKWQPALSQGRLHLDDPAGLVYMLRAYGGKDVAGQARRLIQSKAISAEGRRQLLQLLARVGTAEDLQTVFRYAQEDPQLLQSLPTIAADRRRVPSGVVYKALAALLENKNASSRASAARLAGLWKQPQLIPLLDSIVDSSQEDQVRSAAIRSLSELSPDTAVKRFQPLVRATHSSPIYLAALESVARQDINRAAVAGLNLVAGLENAESYGPVLATIMNRRGGAEALAVALKQADISADDAKLISRWLSAAGHDDADLVNALKSRMGIKQGQAVAYDASRVRSLVEEVRKSGDAAAGKQVFLSSLTNCTACHQVQGVTRSVDAFPKGPDLTAVAAGLQLELIVESVIWPKRQIKEGYEMTTIYTDDGRAYSGYLTSETNGTVGLRDLATSKVREIPAETIEDRINKGTAMPSGFTNSLTRQELRNLIAYLAGLKGSGVKP